MLGFVLCRRQIALVAGLLFQAFFRVAGLGGGESGPGTRPPFAGWPCAGRLAGAGRKWTSAARAGMALPGTDGARRR